MKIVINITGGAFEPPQDLLQKLAEEYVFRLIPCDTFNRCTTRVLDEASKVIQRARDNSGGSLQNQGLIK